MGLMVLEVSSKLKDSRTHSKVATQEPEGQARMMEAPSSSLPSSLSASWCPSAGASFPPLSTQSWCRARRSCGHRVVPHLQRGEAGRELEVVWWGSPWAEACPPPALGPGTGASSSKVSGRGAGAQLSLGWWRGQGWGKGSRAQRLFLQLGDGQFLREEEKAPLAPPAAPAQPHVRAQHSLDVAESLPAEQSRAESGGHEQGGCWCGWRPWPRVPEPQGEPTWSRSSSWPGPSCPGQEGPRRAARTRGRRRERGRAAGCWCRCRGSAAGPEAASCALLRGRRAGCCWLGGLLAATASSGTPMDSGRGPAEGRGQEPSRGGDVGGGLVALPVLFGRRFCGEALAAGVSPELHRCSLTSAFSQQLRVSCFPHCSVGIPYLLPEVS